jgi:hypothetical protein
MRENGVHMFALYQAGSHILGTGETANGARLDALQWLNDPEEAMRARLLRGTRHREERGELYVRPCTSRLLGRVAMLGGELPFTVNDQGVLDLPE